MKNTRSLIGLFLAVGAAVLVWWTQGDDGRADSDVTIAPETTVTTNPATTPILSTTEASATSSDITLETVTITEVTVTEVTVTEPSDDTAVTPTTFVDDGIESIDVDSLPSQASDTLGLIEADGPFPYDQDDGVFQNREGILPSRYDGYYREYTVETPGSGDRGARRIVTGADGEIYYTEDHYESFWRVVT
ncbi:MAG: guanine-specific ribonuclease N1 and T1 [Actinomycetota bacterium]|nr:guanine-specific ribonuclease N1 and T1 [Actinomycetota bacterium]